jgi:hypothetical protein
MRYSSYSFTTSVLDGDEWSASRPGSAFTSREKDPRNPLYRRLGGPQSRSGHRGYRKNPLSLSGIEPRSAGRPARSQILYCLSYPGSKIGPYRFQYCYIVHHIVLWLTECSGKSYFAYGNIVATYTIA